MELKLTKNSIAPPDTQEMTVSTTTITATNDADEVEMAFCLGIQSWCNAMRNAISEFEKEIKNGTDVSEDSSFLIGIVRSVISELTGKHSLLFDIGMDFFDKIVADLASQAKENKVTLRQLSHTWDEKISALYSNVAKHRTMYRAFKKSRPNLSDDELREQIIKWPMGGTQGLPTEKYIKGSILSMWMKGLDDSDWTYGRNHDKSEHPDMQAGYIILDIYCYKDGKDIRTGESKFRPMIKKIVIDDLENQKALDEFKELWKGKSILNTPLNIRMSVIFESPNFMGDYGMEFLRINGSWNETNTDNLPIDARAARAKAEELRDSAIIWKIAIVDKLKLQ